MKSIGIAMAAALLLSGSAMAAEPAACSAADFDYSRYEVFIDAPTGYAFIKTPCGWRFIRQIEASKVADAIQVAKQPRSRRVVDDLRVSLLQSHAG